MCWLENDSSTFKWWHLLNNLFRKMTLLMFQLALRSHLLLCMLLHNMTSHSCCGAGKMERWGETPSFSAWSYIHTYNINTYNTYLHTYLHTYYGPKIVCDTWSKGSYKCVHLMWLYMLGVPSPTLHGGSVNKPLPKATLIKLLMFFKGKWVLLQHAFTRLLWLKFCYLFCRWQFKEQEIW